jgi:hypothetical protein
MSWRKGHQDISSDDREARQEMENAQKRQRLGDWLHRWYLEKYGEAE